MLGLIGNLGPLETVLILVVVVLVFGGRLPEVAREAMKVMAKVRHSMHELKREIDLDGEIRRVESELRREVPRQIPPARTRPLPSEPEPDAESEPDKPAGQDGDPRPEPGPNPGPGPGLG
jgi:Sec-independent protein translocase protein TatA